MALIPCKECGREISASAVACPHCGFAVRQQKQQSAKQLGCALVAGVGVIIAVMAIMGADEKTGPAPKLTGDNLTVESWQAKIALPACKSQAYFDRLADFAAAKDNDAYRKYWVQGLLSGECKLLDAGQKVFIETGGLTGSKCVRVRGETECRYTASSFLEPVK